MNKHFLCRKELAHLVQISTRTIIRNEKSWGLRPQKLNQRVLRYETQKTIRKLRQKGLL